AAWLMPQISAGGGLAIAQREEEAPPTPTDFVTALLDSLAAGAGRRGLDQPLLVVEPGRAIAGPAGVAVYTVGAIKDVPGIRRYVAVDGGMGDNLRPKLYGARYQPMAVKAPGAAATAKVTIVGKYCESTDVLATDEPMPSLEIGDLICFPAAGAYQMSMASNYNGLPRPAVVLVKDGKSRLMRRRETASDLLRSEIF
ncbi:MAG: diaminopimelate decarboxylase family protein, partial [Candidatus Dormibacteraceae bacterium]